MSSSKEQAEESKIKTDVLNLNNEVVRMRKEVKRLRALVIRKMTRQITALKKKKGSVEDLDRNRRRVDRLLEEIKHMKELKPDQVTKAALQRNLSFEKVCKNPASTLCDRATARITSHPQFAKKIDAIKAAVKAFKEERMKAAGTQAGRSQEKPHVSTSQSTAGTQAGRSQEKPHVSTSQSAAGTQAGRNQEKPHVSTSQSAAGTQAGRSQEKPHVSTNQSADCNAEKQEGMEKKEEMEENQVVEEEECDKEQVECKEVEEEVREDEKEEGKKDEKVVEEDEKEELVDEEGKKEVEERKKVMEEEGKEEEGKKVVEEEEGKDAAAESAENRGAAETVPQVQLDILDHKLMTVQNTDTHCLLRPHKVKETTGSQKRPSLKAHRTETEAQNTGEEEEEASRNLESDLESSAGEEEKEYFDDSTEERFRKQSSQSEESEDDNFFLGKVQKFKKKRSSCAPQGAKESKTEPGTDLSCPPQEELDELESRLNSRATKMKSVFCSSLSSGSRRGGQIQPGGRRGGGFQNQILEGGESRFQKQGRGAGRTPTFPGVSRNHGDTGHQSHNSNSAERGRGRGRGGVSRQQGGRGSSHHAPEQALHPSWEASKKRKLQGSQIQVFQGKKITFDD